MEPVMEIINFIVGVIVVAIPIAIIYGLGKWQTKGESDVELGEVFARGFITLALCFVAVAILIIIYVAGEAIVDSLI
jgi:hypothetical protein